MSKYDEDIYENELFKAFLRSHQKTLATAASLGHLVCVPKQSTLSKRYNREERLSHILKPFILESPSPPSLKLNYRRRPSTISGIVKRAFSANIDIVKDSEQPQAIRLSKSVTGISDLFKRSPSNGKSPLTTDTNLYRSQSGQLSSRLNRLSWFSSPMIPPLDEVTHISSKMVGKYYRLEDNSIVVMTVPSKPIKVDILFEECVYLENCDSPLRILCISRPLVDKFITEKNISSDDNLESLESCVDCLLSVDSDILRKINDILRLYYLREFDKNCERLIEDVQSIFKRIQDECSLEKMHQAGQIPFLEKDSSPDDNFDFCLSTYTLSVLYASIFPIICQSLKNEEEEYTEILSDLLVLKIDDSKWLRGKNIRNSILLLQQLENLSTPIEKILIIVKSFKELAASSDEVLTADEMIPLSSALLIQSGIKNLHATLFYIENFLFDNRSFDFSYYITTFRAGLQYILSPNFVLHYATQTLTNTFETFDESTKIRIYQRTDSIFKSDSIVLGDSVGRSNSFAMHRQTYFRLLREMYGDRRPSESDDDISEMISKMCHPLCQCDTCENISRNSFQKPKFKQTGNFTLSGI